MFSQACHSVHNWSYAYSVTAHPCWLLGHLLQCGRYASSWNAFLFEYCIRNHQYGNQTPEKLVPNSFIRKQFPSTLGPTYSEQYDAQKCVRSRRVFVETELFEHCSQ